MLKFCYFYVLIKSSILVPILNFTNKIKEFLEKSLEVFLKFLTMLRPDSLTLMNQDLTH